jgi:putative ABC transport system permease protein
VRYLPLVWAALWRNRTESLLTLLALTVGFTLFGAMLTLNAAFVRSLEDVRKDAAFMFCRFNCPDGLPMGYRSKVSAIEGVVAVGPMFVVRGYRGNPNNPVGISFLDTSAPLGYPVFTLTPAQWRSLHTTPDGIFLTKTAALRQHAKAGDSFTLVTDPGLREGGGTAWYFKVLGVVEDSRGIGQGPRDQFFGNFRYLEESRPPGKRGIAGMFWLALDSQEHARRVCRQITATFTNSPLPVFCVSVHEDAAELAESGVNMRQLSLGVAAAGLFMILFLCANGIAESVRERLGELGTLMTLGYSNSRISVLVFLEAALPTILAAALGMGFTWAISVEVTRLAREGTLRLPDMPLPVAMFGYALSVALLVALVSSLAPLQRVRRLDPASVLAGR